MVESGKYLVEGIAACGAVDLIMVKYKIISTLPTVGRINSIIYHKKSNGAFKVLF